MRLGLGPPGLVDLELDLVADGLHLALVGGAGDHEPAAQCQHLPHLEDHNIVALLAVGGPGGGDRPVSGLVSRGVLGQVHRS